MATDLKSLSSQIHFSASMDNKIRFTSQLLKNKKTKQKTEPRNRRQESERAVN